jgi:hypothetical protein
LIVLAVGIGLGLLMEALEVIWLVIPAGLLLGHAVIFIYCTTSGQWDHWRLLWIPSVMLTIGSIVAPIKIAREPEKAKQTAAYLGKRLPWIAGRAFLGAIGLGLVVRGVAVLLHMLFGA